MPWSTAAHAFAAEDVAACCLQYSNVVELARVSRVSRAFARGAETAREPVWARTGLDVCDKARWVRRLALLSPAVVRALAEHGAVCAALDSFFRASDDSDEGDGSGSGGGSGGPVAVHSRVRFGAPPFLHNCELAIELDQPWARGVRVALRGGSLRELPEDPRPLAPARPRVVRRGGLALDACVALLEDDDEPSTGASDADASSVRRAARALVEAVNPSCKLTTVLVHDEHAAARGERSARRVVVAEEEGLAPADGGHAAGGCWAGRRLKVALRAPF